MATSDPTATIILSELVFIFATLLIGLVGYILFKKRKGASLLKAVSQRIADRKAERINFLKHHFSTIPQTSPEQMSSVSEEIVSNEIEFYQLIINAFAKNDISCIEKLDDELAKLVEPYKKLVPVGGSAEQNDPPKKESDDAIIPDIDDAIDELIGDNDTDPALDLSKQSESDIAEIPDTLLPETDEQPDTKK